MSLKNKFWILVIYFGTANAELTFFDCVKNFKICENKNRIENRKEFLDIETEQTDEVKETGESKAKQELKLKQEAESRVQEERKAEAQAREDAISEVKAKVQQELKLAQEAEARAAALEKLKQEEYEKEKQSAAAKARVLEEIKAEAYAKEKAILEAKAKALADLKAEEIAKKQAEEQRKAQAIIDDKNRVAAAKAAAEQAKKNREQEIAEEKRKIAESQKKLEVLKNKPLEIDNSTVANQFKAEISNKNTRIPIFTLACGAMGGEPLYRIVSNGNDIFLGSERNINNAEKGYEIQVTERQIKFKLKSGSETYGMPEPQMELNRDTLSAFSKQFVDKSIYPPDGIHTVSYKCQTIEDDSIFNTLKNAYESRSAETKKRKQQYDSRPNKI